MKNKKQKHSGRIHIKKFNISDLGDISDRDESKDESDSALCKHVGKKRQIVAKAKLSNDETAIQPPKKKVKKIKNKLGVQKIVCYNFIIILYYMCDY